MSYEKFLETVNCQICDSQDYHVLRKANYPEKITLEELLIIYRSSSDAELMDQLVKCLNCGFVFLNPRVKSKIIME